MVELQEILLSATVIADSFPIRKYLSFYDKNFHGMRGSDFLKKVVSNDNTYSHLFIVPSEDSWCYFERYLKNTDSGFRAINYLCPSNIDRNFDVRDWSEAIRHCKPDFIWVCLGSPKQDFISSAISLEFGITSIAIGAAFNFVSGYVKEAPLFLRIIGLEWLYRLFKEPKRLWRRYLFGNFQFLLLIYHDLIQRKRFMRYFNE